MFRLGGSLALPLFLRSIEESTFSTWMRESESPFVFYFVLLFHTFGLALLVGANALVDLRLLGFSPSIPLAPLKRFFRIMWIGFGINATTGVLLLISYPTKALTNPVFSCHSGWQSMKHRVLAKADGSGARSAKN